MAHTRLVIRIEFLSRCREHGLTPTEVVYCPMPPQGLELTAAEITSWKSSVQDCEKTMLNHMITVCNCELVNRRREMETSDVALTLELLQKMVSTPAAVNRKYNEMFESAQRRRADFTQNINMFRINRQQHPNTSGSRRRRSRSRSQSRSRSENRNRNDERPANYRTQHNGNQNGQNRDNSDMNDLVSRLFNLVRNNNDSRGQNTSRRNSRGGRRDGRGGLYNHRH